MLIGVKRRSYSINITINNQQIKRLIIDPHYEFKHSESISDKLIVELVELLDGGDFTPESKIGSFEYYMTENLILRGKKYRLIWLIEKEELYIGVINSYRRK